MSESVFHFPSTDPETMVGILTFVDCDPDILANPTWLLLPTTTKAKAIVIEKTGDTFKLTLYADFDKTDQTLQMMRIAADKIDERVREVLEI